MKIQSLFLHFTFKVTHAKPNPDARYQEKWEFANARMRPGAQISHRNQAERSHKKQAMKAADRIYYYNDRRSADPIQKKEKRYSLNSSRTFAKQKIAAEPLLVQLVNSYPHSISKTLTAHFRLKHKRSKKKKTWANPTTKHTTANRTHHLSNVSWQNSSCFMTHRRKRKLKRSKMEFVGLIFIYLFRFTTA